VFRSAGTALHRRFFDERDAVDERYVAIIDERLARHFWPHVDPIGHRLFVPTDLDHAASVGPGTDFLTVVGVIHDIALRGVADGAPSVGAYYVPLA
jgi:hypothetical protein